MHKLEELKQMLCDELEKYGSKDHVDAASLDVIDKLAHAVKNIDKILDEEMGEYSGRYDGTRSYAKRDRMGRYSRDNYSMATDHVVDELREIMHDVKDEATKADIRQIIHRMEQR